MITTIELLSSSDCDRILTELEKFKFTDGKRSAIGRAKDHKENFQLESTNSKAAYIFKGVTKLLDNHPYLRLHVSQIIYPRIFANYYSGGNYYGWRRYSFN